MIFGVFLKNFKCYQGTQYIPSFGENSNQFVTYLGDNGVGKSAVLEGLNAFFSKKPHWIRNTESKKGASESFIAPIFLVDKKIFPDDFLDVLEKISGDLTKNKGLSNDNNEKFFVCIAKKENNEFSFYNGTQEISINEESNIASEVYKIISSKYQYVYINAEVNIDDQAKISSDIYEIIMESSIIDHISRHFKKNNDKNKFIEDINTTLKELIDDNFTKYLREIDSDYSYGSSGIQGSISKLTPGLLAEVSTKTFLSSRKLKYKRKKLDDLSSGQRRIALLDFLITVLKNRSFSSKKELIIAIDEPEISLDTGKRMNQFEKISEIAKTGVYTMITSHWYGWIASINFGKSILIEESDTTVRDVKEYLNKDFPFRDIPKYEMRMVFDFLMALGSSAESFPNKKFIICEGPSDQKFIEASLQNFDLYKVIFVSKKEVKKMANIFKDYYWKDSGPMIRNVLFIIDTDPENKDSYDSPYLRRWSKGNDFMVSLVSGSENAHNKCTIENVLEPDIYLDVLKEIYPSNQFINNLEVKYKQLKGFDAFGLDGLNAREFERRIGAQKKEISERYFEKMKQSSGDQNFIKTVIQDNFS